MKEQHIIIYSNYLFFRKFEGIMPKEPLSFIICGIFFEKVLGNYEDAKEVTQCFYLYF